MAGIGEDGDETMSVTEAAHISCPPPCSSFETFLSDFLLSPGPMTLMSNFLSDPESRSFCQLLAGVSPSSPISGAILPTTTDTSTISSDETKAGDEVGKDVGSGYKKNRPENLVVDDDSSFLFTVPPGLSPSWLLNSPAWCQSPFGMSHQQALALVTAQAALSPSYFSIPAEFRTLLSGSTEILEQQSIHSGMSDQEDSHIESNQSLELCPPEKKPLSSSLSFDKPANDGYNWRKYGQKLVKASECPRSYYRCSNINCFVKKQVGHSPDGKVSDIVYKGEHNHEPPQLNKQDKEGVDTNDIQNFLASPELDDLQPLPDTDGFEEFVPSQLLTKDNQVSAQFIHLQESNDAKIRLHDGGHDEPFPKRRTVEVRTSSEPTRSINTVTESKIVVQTRSEVDQFDDGYKWRKYGQKVVKGNTYPRSYYKCTYSGCKVRKQIERASADPESVVTTYEGKHSHDIPLGRKRSNSGSGLQAKPAEHEETNSLIDQTPIFLQLKEEQIKA